MRLCKVTGVEKVLRKLKTGQSFTEKRIRQGLKAGGLFLQRESQKVVPIDTGALVKSAKTRDVSKPAAAEVIVSYRTDYAVLVHEDLEMRHKPGKTAKYLEGPARRFKDQIFKIILEVAGRP
jgi:hypothetical protein